MIDRGSTMGAALRRAAGRGAKAGTIITIGAGAAGDVEWLGTVFPGASHLLIDTDARFEAGYAALARAHAGVRYSICFAGSVDQEVRVEKSGVVGGAVLASNGAPAWMRSIDSLVREHDLKPPFILRFDVNGAEIDIMNGASDTLRQTSLIVMEVYNFKLKFMNFQNLTFPEMALHMLGRGFRVIDICDPLHREFDSALWQFHMLFAPATDPAFQHVGFRG